MKEEQSFLCKIKKVYKNSQLPTKKIDRDAGYDLYIHHIEEYENFIKVYTGIAINPEIGFWHMLTPRSSIYKKGLMLYNSIGVIDNLYTGEIIAILLKTNDFKELPKIGERLVQLIPMKQYLIEFEEVDELSETERGSGGFGSTN